MARISRRAAIVSPMRSERRQHLAHPCASQPADDALQLRNEVALQRVKGDGGGPEHRVLHEHEGEDREQGAALRDRQGEGLPDEPADRFQLPRYHRDDRAGRRPVEMIHLKPEQALVILVAQPAQHTLAHLAFLHVDVQLEPTIDQDQSQKNSAEQKKIWYLFELQPEKFFRRLFSGNGVDNVFRYFERPVKEWEGDPCHDDQIDLFPSPMVEDEPVNRWIDLSDPFAPLDGAGRTRAPAVPMLSQQRYGVIA